VSAPSVPRLSDMTVKTAPVPTSGRTTLWDDGSPLGVRITSNGAKTFIVMIGSGRRHTIGRYGDITLAEARAAAQRIRAEKTLGRIFPEAITLSSARDLYLSQIKVRQATREYYVRHLGKLSGQLVDITTRDINYILDPLPPAARTQALASFRPFFKWCVRRNYLTRSPCELLTTQQQTARDHVLTDDEVRAIWHAAENCGTFGQIVKLLILTGQRRNEIAQLQTSWIKENEITFPKEITKNGTEHTIPFGDLAQKLLPDQNFFKTHSFSIFFPAKGTTSTPFNGFSKSKLALDKKLGPDFKPWTLHDLRRTFATKMAKLGVRQEVTEKLLNHTTGKVSGVAAIYNRHSYLDEMREAIDRYEAWLSTLIT
jgi:integrase